MIKVKILFVGPSEVRTRLCIFFITCVYSYEGKIFRYVNDVELMEEEDLANQSLPGSTSHDPSLSA